jgi:hypothetical protein
MTLHYKLMLVLTCRIFVLSSEDDNGGREEEEAVENDMLCPLFCPAVFAPVCGTDRVFKETLSRDP